MAKKKATHKQRDTEQENRPEDKSLKMQNQTQDKTQTQALSRQPTMEDASEKLQSLKELNSMLIKETQQRRQQVEALVRSKATLEADLSRYGVEKSELEGRLVVESDRNVCLEMEEGLFSFLLSTQMTEMASGVDMEKIMKEDQIRALKGEVSGLMADLESERDRLSGVYGERDLIKSDLDCQMKEANGFKVRLVEMEKREKKFAEEVLMLKSANQVLVKGKTEIEREVEFLRKEKSLLEGRLVETLKEIDDLKGKIEVIVRENKEFEMERSEQEVRINELEKEAVKLKEIISDLQKEERVLREMVSGLERSSNEALEKGDEMALKINVLSGEKNEKQRSIEKLMEEKEDVSQKLEKAIGELKHMEGLFEELLRVKNEIEGRRVSQECEIVSLHKEIDGLRDAVSALKESSMDQEEKSKQLSREVIGYKNDLDRVKLERDDARKELEVEKKNSMLLKSKVSELEKRIKEKVEELAKIRNAHDKVAEEKKKLENQTESLEKEKVSVQNNLLEAQQGVNDLKAKMESFIINSSRAFSMLKSTATLMCQSKDEVEGNDKVVVEKKLDGIDVAYAAELEAIKKAFKNKEKLVEDMKQQVEFMQNSVVEAHKKKSFWTAVSSATTLFAAASVAYAARMR